MNISIKVTLTDRYGRQEKATLQLKLKSVSVYVNVGRAYFTAADGQLFLFTVHLLCLVFYKIQNVRSLPEVPIAIGSIAGSVLKSCPFSFIKFVQLAIGIINLLYKNLHIAECWAQA